MSLLLNFVRFAWLPVETYIRDKVGAHGVLGEMQLCECILKGLKKSYDKSIFPSQTSKEKQRSARRKEANEAHQQQRSELETLFNGGQPCAGVRPKLETLTIIGMSPYGGFSSVCVRNSSKS